MSGRRRKGTTPSDPAGGQHSERMRPGLGVEKGSSSAPVVDEDEDLLDCGVCFHPLKPPIFQCTVGHALCSSCSKKLKDARRCHVCRVAMPGGYQRCHALERVVDSVCGPCPHARYGCDARPLHHVRERHVLQCPHAPYRCPAVHDNCSFLGSVRKLVEHLMEAPHSWPCTAEVYEEGGFTVDLRDGFNFLTAVRGDTQYLLLLNMASTPFFHAICAIWIRSVAAAMPGDSSSAPAATTCDLELQFRQFGHLQQRSRFQIPCTCPSNGLPDPNARCQFFLPKYLGGPDEATVRVTAVISIDSS